MIRLRFVALTAILLIGSWASASEMPRQVWVKAKCALCHGIDGSGQTDRGRKLSTPDLRAPRTQNHSDEELARMIASGHRKMPSFLAMTPKGVHLLVSYIRGSVKPPPRPES